MTKTRGLLFCILSMHCFFAFSQNINVRIFSNVKVEEMEFVPSFGNYILVMDSSFEQKIGRTSKINIEKDKDSLTVKLNGEPLRKAKRVEFMTQGLKAFFKIDVKTKKEKERRYDDNLIVLPYEGKQIMLINKVNIDNYIAGVVQSEAGGATDNVDFFKLQAICVRNYLYTNMNKHANEGFNLCDDTHCQAYLSRANKPQVIQGAWNSKAEVIVDANGDIIETLFHANSGGMTVSAEDVWQKPVDYLQPVTDSFSIGMKDYRWEHFIKMRDWLNYFKGKGLNTKNDSIENALLTFSQQDGRKKDIMGIPLTTVRKDFGLKSTFFSVQKWGGEVKLDGRGYGHGVGLSQQGAINMCEQGYEYWQVVEFYYKGAKVVKREDIFNQLNN